MSKWLFIHPLIRLDEEPEEIETDTLFFMTTKRPKTKVHLGLPTRVLVDAFEAVDVL
jgi:hypothetical protein